MRTAGQNRRRPSERVCTVYTVIVDDPRSDLGDSVYRFRTRREASDFAAGKYHWGAPASVDEDHEVPYRLALRWGCA
jgi:hypothetical protein